MAIRIVRVQSVQRAVAVFISLLACTIAGAAVADQPISPLRPIQAELLGPLDISRVKEGSHVLARVLEDWRDEGCHLRIGAMIEGHVVQVTRRSKTEKTSSMQLAFDKADCNNHPSSDYSLTLIGLIGPFGDPPPGGQSGMGEAPPLADAPSLTIGSVSAPTRNAPNEFRSVEGASSFNDYSFSVRKTRNLPSRIVPGQVIDVPRTNLKVGTGTGGATVVLAVNQDARLERGTTLVLLSSSSFLVQQRPVGEGSHQLLDASARPPAANRAGVPAGVASLTPQPAPEPPDETEVCSGACNVLSPTDSHLGSSAASAKVAIEKLGYAPHDKQRAVSLDHETTITYLDEQHLLCTFDPHRLRFRSDDGTDPARTVRAVVINTISHTVDKVTDWRVRGNDDYLWRLGGGQILVHMGHQLRRFDAQLKPMQSIPADGHVAWVVSSPSNDHIAVAVLKARYSEAVYREMEDLAVKPDEDLEVRVYDGSLNLISVSIRSSQSLQPVLSDGGELRVIHQTRGRWKIVEYRWDRTERAVATVKSVCRPLLSAPQPGLTFVTGCMASSGDTWYRMLRSDGHALLKAESPANEIGQTAESTVAGSFTVRVLEAVRPINVDQSFNRSDLTREQITVFRNSDGTRLSTVATDDFILAQNSYALSPHGDQLAVVGKDSVNFYNVKTQ